MSRLRLEALQWFALLAAPLAWTAQLVVGYGAADAGCAVAGSQWGLDATPLEIALTLAAATVALAAEASALLVLRATRDVHEDAAGPLGRLRFFATAALLGNVLFFVIIVLDGVGTAFHDVCRQS